jgi:hypothetical protein
MTATAAALESDLRGDVAVCLMSLFSWVDFHGGRTALISDTIERFITVGRPADRSITRAIGNARASLCRYLAAGGEQPAWLPQSIVDLLKDPVLAPQAEALPPTSPTEIP